MFLKQYHAGLEELIHIVLPHSYMTLGNDFGRLQPFNHLKLAKHVFLYKKVEADLTTTSFCRVIDSFQLNNFIC